MLHLPRHHFSLPHLTPSRQVALSRVAHEDDELIHEIESAQEEAWQLDATPDVRQLDEFWSGVQQDLEKDPTWFNFADDEE